MWGLPPDPRKSKPAAKPKKAKPAAKPKARPAAKPKASSRKSVPLRLPQVEPVGERGGRYNTLRSPGGVLDPKVDEAQLQAALAAVGTPKLKRNVSVSNKQAKISSSRSYGYPSNADYLTVAYGGGVDSTAMLVGLDQLWNETRDPKWIPRSVTFSDTGGEHPETYEFILFMDGWLKKAFKGGPWHPGGVTKVCYSTLQRSTSWGTGYTLEQQQLINHSLPSISMGGHTCSTKYKIDAQRLFFEHCFKTKDELLHLPRKGRRVLRAIGYDETEAARLEKSSTYAAQDEERHGIFSAWYPLIEWGWDRARCVAEIYSAMGRVPRKSSCFFCGAMQPEEIIRLAREHPDLLERAIFLERVAKLGRNRPHGGLNRGGWEWKDFVLGNAAKLPPKVRVFLVGGVIRRHAKSSNAVKKTIGKKRSEVGKLAPNETYVEGVGRIMSQSAFNKLEGLAERWVVAGPDKGRRVRGWRNLRSNEEVAGRQTRQKKIGNKVVTQVKDMVPDDSKKGHYDHDMGLHPLTKQIPAFCKPLGFRTQPKQLAWNVLKDNYLENEVGALDASLETMNTSRPGTKTVAKASERAAQAEISIEKIREIVARTAKGRLSCSSHKRNPQGGRRLPVVYESMLLFGTEG